MEYMSAAGTKHICIEPQIIWIEPTALGLISFFQRIEIRCYNIARGYASCPNSYLTQNSGNRYQKRSGSRSVKWRFFFTKKAHTRLPL